jgi:TPR repeat protein
VPAADEALYDDLRRRLDQEPRKGRAKASWKRTFGLLLAAVALGLVVARLAMLSSAPATRSSIDVREVAGKAAVESNSGEAARLAAEEAKKKEAARRVAEERKEAAREFLAWEATKKAATPAKPVAQEPDYVVRAVTARPAEETRPVNGPELFARARALESQGKVAEAVKLYIAAANTGDAAAAKKLGDIYSAGKGDVAQDSTASLSWYQRARLLGVQVKGK